MATIGVERSNPLLLTEKTKLPFGQVKQRADAWIGLAIVIPECALVIAAKASDAPVRDESPVVAEAFVDFDFHSLVFALGILVSIGLPIGLKFSAEQCTR